MIRTSPPTNTSNNQDALIWALYQLGGADQSIDVEAIYLKAFAIAPARLGWRTRPEIPDYKKLSKALQSVEAKTHQGLVRKIDVYTRRLTPEGATWVETYHAALERLYSSAANLKQTDANQYEAIRSRVIATDAYRGWSSGTTLDAVECSVALDCSAAAPTAVWARRSDEIIRAGSVLDDDALCEFGRVARAIRLPEEGA